MKTFTILFLLISVSISAQFRISGRSLPDTTITGRTTVILTNITGKSIAIKNCKYIFILGCSFSSDSIPVTIINASTVTLYNVNTYQLGKYNINDSYNFVNVKKLTIDGGSNSTSYESDALKDNAAYEDILNQLKDLFLSGKTYVPKALRDQIINGE